MNIRLANKFDVPQLVELMRHYSGHSPIKTLQHQHNPQHVEQLLHSIVAGMGIVWVADNSSALVGMLVTVRHPNIWNPKMLLLNELAYWVEPEYRHTTVAYRLFRAYEQTAQDEFDRGAIIGWTISKLRDSEFDPERRGYEHIESTYIKQGH